MRQTDLTFTFGNVSASSEEVQTGTIPVGRGFRYLKVDIAYNYTIAAVTAGSSFNDAISQFTFEQPDANGGRRLNVRPGNLYHTISALNRSTDSKTMEQLVFDPATVTATATRCFFYVPITTTANTGGITITMGINCGLIGGVAASTGSATVRFSLVGESDGRNPRVVGVPTANTAGPSRITIPAGRVVRTVISDSVANNLTILRLPGETFTDATVLTGEWHMVNGAGNRDAGTPAGNQNNVPNIGDEAKNYMYTYAYTAESGATLEFERAAASTSNVFFVLG